MNKLKSLGKYSAAVTFLAFEFFALIAFNYSGSFVLFGALSLALCILLILFNIAEIKSKGLSSVALFFIPLFLYVLLTTVGSFTVGHAYVGDISWAQLVFIPLGLLPMAFNGYMLSIDKSFKIKTFLMVVFSALAVYVLINFIYNLISFGAFYPLIYKGYYLYYSGIRSQLPVNEFAYVLEGFKFIEVKMSHYALYPLLLLSSCVMLLFTSPKKEKVSFYTYLAFTLLAVFALTFIPSYYSLGGIVGVALLLLVIYFGKTYIKSRIAFKYILYIVLALFILGFLFYVIVVATGVNKSFTGFLSKVFVTNKYSQKVNPILEGIFSSDKFLGFYGNKMIIGDKYVVEPLDMSGFYLFDIFMTSGVIGAVAFFALLFVGFKSFKKYFYSHKDEFRFQATMLMFLMVFVIYISFFSEGDYALYYKVYKPIYLRAPFMLMVFMFFYVICRSRVDTSIEESKKEEVSVNA